MNSQVLIGASKIRNVKIDFSKKRERSQNESKGLPI